MDETAGSYDVISIGAGLGGLAASASRSCCSRRPLLYRRRRLYGGLCWILGFSAGDSIEQAASYLSYSEGEHGSADQKLRLGALTAMHNAGRFFGQAGIPLEVVPRNPDVFYPQSPGSVASGRMFEAFLPGTALGRWRDRSCRALYRIGLTHHEFYGSDLSAT